MKILNYFSLIIASLFLLSGCTGPNMLVSSLGRVLPAPILTSSNLSNVGDSADQQKYLRFTGTCNPRFASLKLGYKSSATSPTTYADQSLFVNTNQYTTDSGFTFASKPSDLDCSDGIYDFILNISDIKSILGLNSTAIISKNSLYSLSITGSSAVGESGVLEIDARDIGTNTPTESIGVRKLTSTGFTNLCEEVEVYVSDQSGKLITRGTDTF